MTMRRGLVRVLLVMMVPDMMMHVMRTLSCQFKLDFATFEFEAGGNSSTYDSFSLLFVVKSNNILLTYFFN